MRLQGDFKLPNNKSSCVALVQREHLFDIACYQIEKKPQEQDTQLPPAQFLGTIKIQSLLPNPLGKDSNKEEIQLLYQGEEAKIDLEHFHLLINGKNKKKLSGELLQNQSQTLI
ncbi:MAG: hypothetical protein Q4B28_00545 [bacterium]|nr:hypothetical protein [bacterium]